MVTIMINSSSPGNEYINVNLSDNSVVLSDNAKELSKLMSKLLIITNISYTR